MLHEPVDVDGRLHAQGLPEGAKQPGRERLDARLIAASTPVDIARRQFGLGASHLAQKRDGRRNPRRWSARWRHELERFGIPAALSVHKRWSVREALQLRGVARQARRRDVDAERRAEVPGELHQAAQSPDPNRLIISLASAVVAISRRSGWVRISSANSARSAAGSYSTVPAIRADPPAPPNRTPFGGTGPYCARAAWPAPAPHHASHHPPQAATPPHQASAAQAVQHREIDPGFSWTLSGLHHPQTPTGPGCTRRRTPKR